MQALLVVVTTAALAPFLNKAFHIDDPLFLWMAQQIAKHPLDPYGFEVNWVSLRNRCQSSCKIRLCVAITSRRWRPFSAGASPPCILLSYFGRSSRFSERLLSLGDFATSRCWQRC